MPTCNIRTWPALAVALSVSLAARGETNDFGNEGLMQTPTARFAGEGLLRAGYSNVWPYETVFIGAQPFDWLEATYRYVRFDNYSPAGYAYLDKSIDLKLKLWEEGPLYPDLALGIQDFGGTGLLASEFVVASKRVGDLDFSLGLGWGRLGSAGHLDNPLGHVAERFNRQRSRGSAGDFDLGRLFAGRDTALFGGVSWNPGDGPLTLQLEYEGNDYEDEPGTQDLGATSPVNIGLHYRWRGVELGAAWERGNEFALRLALSTNLQKLRPAPPVFDPPPTPVGPDSLPAPDGPPPLPGPETQIELRDALERQNIRLTGLSADPIGGTLTVHFRQGTYRKETDALERVARTLASLAPAGYDRFVLISEQVAVQNTRVEVERAPVRASANAAMSSPALQRTWVYLPPDVNAPQAQPDISLVEYPEWTWGQGPKLRQSVGDPLQVYFGQIWWSIFGRLQLNRNWDFSGTVGIDIWNNFDDITRESDSKLPHVRSDIAEYLKQGENNIVRLETNYIWSPARSWYTRLSAGIFEEMYGGVAGEVLYRPFAQDWAVGVNVNRVRQRDYDQLFAFRDYEVTTGHLTLYHEYRPLSLRTIVSAGRYLAGDWGATFDVSRRFRSGVRLGVFATKTNVSSEEFGEGSFDKGFYVAVPLDLFFPRSDRRTMLFPFRPLTRDGGQKVDDGRSLYGLTQNSDLNSSLDMRY